MSGVKKEILSKNICQALYINTRGILDFSRIVSISSFQCCQTWGYAPRCGFFNDFLSF